MPKQSKQMDGEEKEGKRVCERVCTVHAFGLCIQRHSSITLVNDSLTSKPDFLLYPASLLVQCRASHSLHTSHPDHPDGTV